MNAPAITIPAGCPAEAALDVIAGKWKGMLIFHLLGGTRRFNQLQRMCPGINQRMLTKQLRELEDAGLVLRTVHPVVPPHVDYQLSELGQALQPVMSSLQHWGNLYLSRGGRHGRCSEGQLHSLEETEQF